MLQAEAKMLRQDKHVQQIVIDDQDKELAIIRARYTSSYVFTLHHGAQLLFRLALAKPSDSGVPAAPRYICVMFSVMIFYYALLT